MDSDTITDPGLHVVLVAPEIAPNTGNIARTCVAIGAALHLIRPLGFVITDRALRRAGMDYWHHVDLTIHDDWPACQKALEPVVKQWLYFATNGTRRYSDVDYTPGTALVFGSEGAGLPAVVTSNVPPSQLIRIPMRASFRSLNLASAVAIVAYEARRQQGFPNME